MEEKNTNLEQKARDKSKIVGLLLIEAGIEFALLIAVPLVAGIFAGKWMDQKFNKSFFIPIGIVTGIIVSSLAIASKVKDYKNILNKK